MPLQRFSVFFVGKKGPLKTMRFVARYKKPSSKDQGTSKAIIKFSPNKYEIYFSSVSCYDYVLFAQETKAQPIQVNVFLDAVSKCFLDEVKGNMELDTGVSRSMISRSTFKSLWPTDTGRPELYPSTVNLRVYDVLH